MNNLLERINSITWSSSIQVGKIESAFYFDTVHNKQDVLKEDSILDFEDFLLNERNRLTIFLHDKDRVNYNKWNEIVTYYKPKIESLKLIFDKKEFILVRKNLEMILMMTIMEQHYRLIQKKTPIFFLELLVFLENGYIPCGWDGEIIDSELNTKFDFNSGVLRILPINYLFENWLPTISY